MLMGAHSGRVNEVDFPINVVFVFQCGLQLSKHCVPRARLAPALKTAIDGRPFSVSLGQVTPRGTRSQNPKDAIQDLAMSLCGTSAFRLLFRKVCFNSVPFFVGEVASVSHGDQFTRYFGFCIHALVSITIFNMFLRPAKEIQNSQDHYSPQHQCKE